MIHEARDFYGLASFYTRSEGIWGHLALITNRLKKEKFKYTKSARAFEEIKDKLTTNQSFAKMIPQKS